MSLSVKGFFQRKSVEMDENCKRHPAKVAIRTSLPRERCKSAPHRGPEREPLLLGWTCFVFCTRLSPSLCG